MTNIELREYDLLRDIFSEEDALNELFDYSVSAYICDAITDIVDGHVPIYTSELWNGASEIGDYVEEAVMNGLVDTGRDFTIEKMFQCGFYEYYTQLLYNNLDNLVYNKIAEKVEEYLDTLDTEEIENLDIFSIEHDISAVSDSYDNHCRISAIFEDAQKIIEDINNGEYNIEEKGENE